MKPVIVLFTRNLRLEDNAPLSEAVHTQAPVIPCYIAQADTFSSFAGTFILESLHELHKALQDAGGRLYVFSGNTAEVLSGIAEAVGETELFIEEDVSPGFHQLLSDIPESFSVRTIPDKTLTHPREIQKSDGTAYKVFSHYLAQARRKDIKPPLSFQNGRWYGKTLEGALGLPPAASHNTYLRGGRENGLTALSSLSRLSSYPSTRDIPSIDTSRLSAHLAWGTLSIREVYFAALSVFPDDPVFINELFWRDFWLYIAYHYPHVFTSSFYKKFDSLHWQWNSDHFNAWCFGRTGFPLVDAGMRELNQTGFMHNRVRMTAASFLTKDLHISWKKGEAYFASLLADYDHAVNNGNWQWAASTGCDAQPFFRIFNPWSQQKRFDPEAEYIHRWIPELRKYQASEIHRHETSPLPDYPPPMVSHREERKLALEWYRSV